MTRVLAVGLSLDGERPVMVVAIRPRPGAFGRGVRPSAAWPWPLASPFDSKCDSAYDPHEGLTALRPAERHSAVRPSGARAMRRMPFGPTTGELRPKEEELGGSRQGKAMTDSKFQIQDGKSKLTPLQPDHGGEA